MYASILQSCVSLFSIPPDTLVVLTQMIPTSTLLCAAGQFIPIALALVATCVISCRSVTSKAVAGLTGTTEYDTFLEASVPG